MESVSVEAEGTYEIEEGRVSSQAEERGAADDDLEGPRAQRREVEIRRLVLHLVLVLPLALGHVLQVQYGSALRVVQAGRPVEQAHEEERRDCPRERLQAEAPAECAASMRACRYDHVRVRRGMNLLDAVSEDVGEDGDARAGAHAGEHLDHLSLALEVLAQHERRRLAHHGQAQPQENAVAEKGRDNAKAFFQRCPDMRIALWPGESISGT